MEKIIISQNDNQNINIISTTPQLLNIKNLNSQNLKLKQNLNQNLNINQSENQILLINEVGEIIGIKDVLVNNESVVKDSIAYVIVPTKVSELTNDMGYITNETDPTVPYYIKSITISDINNWNNKQDTLVSGTNIKTINGNSILGSGNMNIDTSYTAGTGINIDSENVISNEVTSYNDLTDLPTIPTKVSDLNNDLDFVETNELSEVAFTGSYASLSNTPEYLSEFVNDEGFIDKDVNDLTYYTLSSNLSTVATTGDYDDLIDKPTIPTNLSDLNNDTGFVSETDYASNSHGGVIKTGINSYDINSVGYLYADTQTYADYGSMANTNFIGKGTLENVITGKGLIDNNVNNLTNYVNSTTLSSWTDISSSVTVGSNYTSQEKRIFVNTSINLCYVHLNVKATSTSGDIASGLPKALMSLSLSAFNFTTSTPFPCWVRNAGTMACGSNHAINDEIKICGCYPYSSL